MIKMTTEEMVDRYKAGESLEAIGDAAGCAMFTVRERLRRAGVPRRPKGTPPDISKDAQILELVAGGLSTYQMAFVMNCSRTNIRRRLTRLAVCK